LGGQRFFVIQPSSSESPALAAFGTVIAASEGRTVEPAIPRYDLHAFHAARKEMKNTRIIVTHNGNPDALQVTEPECAEPVPARTSKPF
jgi:hypothetical protein